MNPKKIIGGSWPLLLWAVSGALAFYWGYKSSPSMVRAPAYPVVANLSSPMTDTVHSFDGPESLNVVLSSHRAHPFALAVRAGNAADRTSAFLAVLRHFESDEDFKSGLKDVCQQLDKTERKRYLGLLFRQWLDKNPKAALAEVRHVDEVRYDKAWMGEMFSDWADASPGAAIELLRAIFDGNERNPQTNPAYLDGVDQPDFLLNVVHGLVRTDVRKAAVTVAELPHGLFQRRATELLMQTYFPADPESAKQWALNQTNLAFRTWAVGVVADKIGQSADPAAGANWALSLASKAEAQRALGRIADQWSQRQAVAAFQWAQGLGDDQLKFAVMAPILRHLAVLEPGMAADWLNHFGPSPQLDDCVSAYAKGIQFINPPAALGSLAGISDEARRLEALKTIASKWLNRDPVSARAYIRDSPLFPGSLKARLLAE